MMYMRMSFALFLFPFPSLYYTLIRSLENETPKSRTDMRFGGVFTVEIIGKRSSHVENME